MRINVNEPAPDFTLVDIHRQEVSLSQFQGQKNVLLVFNRSFV
jgi:peroxiredoxin